MDGFKSPDERRRAIADEVELYVLWARNHELPPGAVLPESMPEALLWLRRIERWGPAYVEVPYPCHFLLDLESARVGEARVDEMEAANVRNKALYRARQ